MIFIFSSFFHVLLSFWILPSSITCSPIDPSSSLISSSSTNSSRRSLGSFEKETIRIVTYNNIVGYLNWHEPFFADYIASKCHTNCKFSMDINDINNADVVVFLASTFHRSSPLFPKKAKPSTIFVLHTMEQPMYATMLNDHQFLKQHFDLLAMYSQETIYPGSGVPNLPLTYYPLHVYEPTAVLSPMKSFKEKDGYGTGKKNINSI